MFDIIFDFLGDALESLFDFGGDVADAVADVASNVDLGDVLLIGSTLYVANLTVNSIQEELRGREDLKSKGVTNVVIKEFLEKNDDDCTVLSLDAFDASGNKVGNISMKGKSCSGLYKGQRIQI